MSEFDFLFSNGFLNPKPEKYGAKKISSKPTNLSRYNSMKWLSIAVISFASSLPTVELSVASNEQVIETRTINLNLANNKTNKLILDWDRYLNNLVLQSYCSRQQIDEAKKFLNSIKDKYACDLPIPQTSITVNGALQFVWDKNEHHLELEILNGKYEWFYRNRLTNKFDGEENCKIGVITSDFIRFFSMFSSSYFYYEHGRISESS